MWRFLLRGWRWEHLGGSVTGEERSGTVGRRRLWWRLDWIVPDQPSWGCPGNRELHMPGCLWQLMEATPSAFSRLTDTQMAAWKPLRVWPSLQPPCAGPGSRPLRQSDSRQPVWASHWQLCRPSNGLPSTVTPQRRKHEAQALWRQALGYLISSAVSPTLAWRPMEHMLPSTQHS